jgi:hypothetical protein
MSILNVNTIQPVGTGQTVTVSATDLKIGTTTLSSGGSGTFVGNVTGNITGNVTGNVNSSGVSTITTLQTGAIQTTAGKPILNSTGSILQVVSTTKTDTFTVATTTYTDVTGLSASITPSSTSSKILVMCYAHCISNSQQAIYIRITRGGSTISGSLSSAGSVTGTTVAIQSSSGFITYAGAAYQVTPLRLDYLDSPASTSSQTYQIQVRGGSSANNIYVNYQGTATTNNNNSDFGYYVSSITLLEVSA